jgi:hypothetical protein
MNEQLDKNMIAEKVKIDMGENGPPITPIIIAVEKVDNDEVAAIRSSHYYQTIKSLVNKLSPIVEMIEEAEPEIKKELDE